ncbi:MAG: heparan-alpha-glucosaminide N-acetyltransferase domain-containing protein [Candidatus Thorarchaeota archaeon]
MKRIKSIDIFRGLGMVYIMVGHMIDWWSQSSDNWLFYVYVSLFSALGAAGFVFISGVSTMISYRNRLEKARNSLEYNMKIIKKEYYIRAFLILGLALVYNFIVVIQFFDITIIWKWFIILTVAGCLLLAWPVLRTSKLARILIGLLIWGINQFLLHILLPFEAQGNFPGIIFYIFYNSKDQNPILSFFTFFLIGTVLGDVIYDFSLIEDDSERKKVFKEKIAIPLLLIGLLLIAVGIPFLYPDLFSVRILTININFWWQIYTIGLDLIIILVILSLEVYGFFTTKKSYRFLFYFSYYSLSLFLLQNINFILFYDLLNRYNIWFFILVTIILYGIFLRFMYMKLERKFSLKVQIGKLSVSLALKNKKCE